MRIKKIILIIVLLLFNPCVHAEGKDATISEMNVKNIYNVQVIWNDMKFVYIESPKFTWNSINHSYDFESIGTWQTNSNTIKINNKSNTTIKVNFDYNSNYSNINGSFNQNNIMLKANESNSSRLYLNGVLDSSINDFIKVGVVKITIE